MFLFETQNISRKTFTQNVMKLGEESTEASFSLGRLVLLAPFDKQQKETPSDSNSEHLCVSQPQNKTREINVSEVRPVEITFNFLYQKQVLLCIRLQYSVLIKHKIENYKCLALSDNAGKGGHISCCLFCSLSFLRGKVLQPILAI